MDQETTSQSESGPLHLAWRLTILTLALVVAVGPTSEACVERTYSRGLYPIIQQVFTSLSNQVPVALFDFLVIGFVVALIAKCIVIFRRSSMVRRPVVVLVLIREVAVVVALVYIVFMLCWGFNYRRESLESKLDFDTSRITPASLETLARESIVRLNRLHGLAQARPWPTLESVPKVLAKPFRYAQEQLPASAEPRLARPKTSWFGFYFRQAAIDGFTDPFLLETLINSDVLPYERPFIVLHEWAHLAGYADEAEASFVAWLASQSGDAAVQYSAWLFLHPYLMRQLDTDTRSEVTAALQLGPARDLVAIRDRLGQSMPVVRRQASWVYDRYLRANRVSSGIASYGRVLDLVLGSRVSEVDS